MSTKPVVHVIVSVFLALWVVWAIAQPAPENPAAGFNLCRTNAELATLPKGAKRCVGPDGG